MQSSEVKTLIDTGFAAYKQRLSEWVDQEIKRHGSGRKFEQAFNRAQGDGEGLSDQALANWRRQLLKNPLSRDSLEKIAKYRDWSVDRVSHWLQTGDEVLPKSSELVAAMRSAPLSEVLEAMQIGLQRLSFSVTGSGVESMEFNSVGAVIRYEFEQLGLSVDRDFSELSSRLAIDSDEELDRYREIVAGQAEPTETELLELSHALADLTAKPYSPDLLQQRESPDCFQPGHQSNGVGHL